MTHYHLFHRHFKQFVGIKFSIFNTKGLRTIGTFALKLEKVFIEPLISPVEDIDKLSHKFLSSSKKTLSPKRLKLSIWNLILNNDKTTNVNIIVGPPGSGKTMLIQYISLVYSTNKYREQNKQLKYYIPCFLFLREHVKDIVKRNIHLDRILHKEYSDKGIGEKKKAPPKNWFYNNLRKGNCIILLDGLDEVADKDTRKKISSWVEKEILRFSKCQFIITSRPLGYIEAPIKVGNIFEVLSFNQIQAEQFINNYYLLDETYRQSLVRGDYSQDQILDRAKEGANDLINRLNKTPSLKDLTENPLLLSMITMMHRYRAKLPQHRIELYSEITDVLLLHWREVKSLNEDINSKKVVAILMKLAMRMMNEGIVVLKRKEAHKIIEESSKDLGLGRIVVDNFLEIVNRNSGLLLEKERGLWGFAHLTFQEYYASLRVADKNPRKASWFDDIVTDSWWKETLLLYSASSDASELIDCCLTNGSKEALYLAMQCLNEAFSVREDVRRKAEKILDANSLLYKRVLELKTIQLLNEKSIDIDMSFISFKEYLLFCHESNSKDFCYYLDHWNKEIFSKKITAKYLLGVSSYDSLMFCAWLTKKKGNKNCLFRLPTIEEAIRNPIETNQEFYAYWVLVEDEVPKLYYVDDLEEIIFIKSKFPKSSVKMLSEPELLNLVNTGINYIKNDVSIKNMYKLDIAISLALSIHIFKNLNLNSKSPISNEIMYQIYFRFIKSDLTRDLNCHKAFKKDFEKEVMSTSYMRNHLQTLINALSDIFKIPDLSRRFQHESIFCRRIFKIVKSYQDEKKDINLILKDLSKILTKNDHQCILKSYFVNIFNCINLENTAKEKIAFNDYLIQLTELAFVGYVELQRDDIPEWVKKIQGEKGYHIPGYNYEEELGAVVRLHWWSQLMVLRRNNILEPWESIRIVKEIRKS